MYKEFPISLLPGSSRCSKVASGVRKGLLSLLGPRGVLLRLVTGPEKVREMDLRRAIAGTGAMPERIVTDKARCYPPAVRAVLPGTEHQCSKYLNNGLERDHSYLKQRLMPMRGFKRLASADVFCRGPALIRNLRGGFSKLTAKVPPLMRLATAWPQLARVI